ncbi:MAG: hypothetical protein K6A82_05525 [Prevotella sp.]|nr:hypothetical protein [Prevotella sp.]
MRTTLRKTLLWAALSLTANMTAQAQSAADMTLTFPDSLIGQNVEIAIGGSAGNKFQIDWGDGVLKEYSSANYYSNQLQGNTVKVYGSQILLLYANSCGLTALDIDNEPDIYMLRLQDNAITTLDLTNCGRLRGVYAANNKLTSVALGRNYSSNGVVVDFAGNQLSGTIDLSAWENLSQVDITGNKVEKLLLPVSNTLYKVVCDNNRLTELDIAGRANVDELSINGNQIISLDLTGMTKLDELHASNNLISSVKLDGCTTLTHLSLDGNKLENIDLSMVPNLEGVYLYDNQLTSLDLSSNHGVRYLNIDNNQLRHIDTSTLPQLSTLQANNNQLESADLTNNPMLTSLQLANNHLTELKPFAANYLSQLRLDDNQISSIDLSGYPYLYWARLANNRLTALDVSHNSYLQWLAAENNGLSTLSLSTNIDLQGLTLQGNKMQADVINTIISQLADVSNVSINHNNEQFAKQLNISYMPGTEAANIAEAQAKGWIVTAEKTTAGISTAPAANTTSTAIYNANGMRLKAEGKGLNIIRMEDGSVRKVIRR